MKKKGTGIRVKLIGIIIPIVLVIIVSFFALARNMVLKSSEDNLKVESRMYAEQINSWTNQIFSELNVYKSAIESGVFADDDEILEYMVTSCDKNEAYPVGLYMGDDSGIYLDGSGWVPGDDWVLVEREWYIDGKDNETFAFGEPYYDSMTGQMCVSASVKVDYTRATRVLATDVYLDYVVGLVSDMVNESDLQVFLVTKDSQMIIAHPDTGMLAKTLDTDGIDSLYGNIGNELSGETDEIITVDSDNDEYMVCINAIKDTDWYLVTYVTEEKVLADLYQMQMIMVIIAIVAAVVLILAVLRIMNNVVKPVKRVTDVIGNIAKGDFTQDIAIKGTGEIATMSSNMQEFILQMRRTISEISDTANWLNKQSVDNENVSESLKASSENQYRAMEVLGEMVEKLSAAAGDVSQQMERLAELIHATRTDGEAADELMRESVGMSRNGKTDMENIHEGMTNINMSITTLSQQIAKVGEATAQIENMVNMIINIASETNLLSLNASIEAARAGEAGRGFTIVAEQIGKLAADSSVAADDISKLTAMIKETVQQAVIRMDESVDEVQKNVVTVAAACETFDMLYEKIDVTSQRVEKMISAIEEVDVVAGNMEQITAEQVHATEQISESAKDLEHHTRNVASDSNVVAKGAQELKDESVELMKHMSVFVIEKK